MSDLVGVSDYSLITLVTGWENLWTHWKNSGKLKRWEVNSVRTCLFKLWFYFGLNKTLFTNKHVKQKKTMEYQQNIRDFKTGFHVVLTQYCDIKYLQVWYQICPGSIQQTVEFYWLTHTVSDGVWVIKPSLISKLF